MDMICAECGYRGKTADEYHPWAFCALVKAKLDPWQVIAEALPYVGQRRLSRPPRKVKIEPRRIVIADGTRGMLRGV